MGNSKTYIEDTENALNNPPKGYEVWNTLFNPATMNETHYSAAGYHIIYKRKEPELINVNKLRKFKELEND